MTKKINWPMTITLSRIAFTPFIIFLHNSTLPQKEIFTALLFIIASLTDWLDGWMARYLKQESALGQFLDPAADKILVLMALVLLHDSGKISALLVYILISRDLLIDGIRSAAASKHFIIAAAPIGKLKTAVQMFALSTLFLEPLLPPDIVQLSHWALWLSVILSYYSAFEYILGYLRKVEQ